MRRTCTTICGRPSSGFTLLEVILAMAVGAIVILAIQSVFFGALRLRNTSEQRTERELSLYRALDLMKKDFAGLMLPGGVLAADFQTETSYSLDSSVSGERISAEFFTDSGLIDAFTPFADVQRVAYYLSPSPDSDQQELVRTVSRNLLPTVEDNPEIQPLLEGVESAYFEYFDGSSWTETWDSSVTSSLPTAVRLTLQLSGEPNASVAPAPIEMVFPIYVSLGGTTAATLEPAQ
ncbi:MAG: type II secretion system minor pseudopilin GspJ [Opitutaceae bacterium]|nr:type II secretion system minor pseudopilin GspJ [Opitutaceae bacterium]